MRPLTIRSESQVATPLPALVAFTVSLAFFLGAGVDTAWAEEEDPYDSYFEFQAGPAFIPNQTLDAGATGMSRVEPDEAKGFHVGGALGHEVLDLFRAELAIGYRESGVDQAGVVAVGQADGDISLLTLMLNGYVDLDLGREIPYAGLGFGYGLFKLDI